MRVTLKNKKKLNSEFSLEGLIVLDYDQLLHVNGAGGSGSSGGGGSSSGPSGGNLTDQGYPSSTDYNPGIPPSNGPYTGGQDLKNQGYPSSTDYNPGIPPSNGSYTGGQGGTPQKIIAKVANGIAYPLGVEYENIYVVTSNFGPRDSIETSNGYTGKFHSGIDISAPRGTRINSVSDGIVQSVGYSNDLGNYVVVKHTNGATTRYAHCDGVNVTVGLQVVAGEQIATVGTTGMSTGPHLHFSFDGNGNGTYNDNYYDNPSRILGY